MQVCPTARAGGLFVAGGYTPGTCLSPGGGTASVANSDSSALTHPGRFWDASGIGGAQQHSSVVGFNQYGQQRWETLPSMRGERAGACACLLVGWRAAHGRLVAADEKEPVRGEEEEDDDDEWSDDDEDDGLGPAVVLVIGGHVEVTDANTGKVQIRRLTVGQCLAPSTSPNNPAVHNTCHLSHTTLVSHQQPCNPATLLPAD